MADVSDAAEKAVDKVVALIVILAIVGGTIALVFTNLGTTVLAFTNVSTGNATLDTVIKVLALPVGFIVIFGVIKIIKHSIAQKTGK